MYVKFEAIWKKKMDLIADVFLKSETAKNGVT